MSRIGNKTITIPEGVELTVTDGNEVTVKGPKGTLTRTFSSLMDITVENGVLTVKRPNEEKHTKQLHGTTRALINAMVEGVNKGFTKQLKIVGIGYRVAKNGNGITLSLGYSHPIEIAEIPGITFELEVDNRAAGRQIRGLGAGGGQHYFQLFCGFGLQR